MHSICQANRFLHQNLSQKMFTFSYPQLSLLEEKQGGNNGTNIFAPTNYSTPACSPRRQMSEPPPPSDYVSSPRPSNRFVFCLIKFKVDQTDLLTWQNDIPKRSSTSTIWV